MPNILPWGLTLQGSRGAPSRTPTRRSAPCAGTILRSASSPMTAPP